MRIVITDLVTGKCTLTKKQDVECVRVQFDDRKKPIQCVPSKLIELIRERKEQDGDDLQTENNGD